MLYVPLCSVAEGHRGTGACWLVGGAGKEIKIKKQVDFSLFSNSTLQFLILSLPPNLQFFRPDLKVLKGGLKVTRIFLMVYWKTTINAQNEASFLAFWVSMCLRKKNGAPSWICHGTPSTKPFPLLSFLAVVHWQGSREGLCREEASVLKQEGRVLWVFTFYLKLLKHQFGLAFPSTCLTKELEGTWERSCAKEKKKRNFDLKDLIGAEWFGCH